MWATHHQLLELFCQTEQVFVCQIRTEMSHKFHPVVPLKEEYEVRTAQLGEIEAEVQQRIQDRQRIIQEIKYTMEWNQQNADREHCEGEQVLASLLGTVEEAWQDFYQTVNEDLKSAEERM